MKTGNENEDENKNENEDEDEDETKTETKTKWHSPEIEGVPIRFNQRKTVFNRPERVIRNRGRIGLQRFRWPNRVERKDR